MRTLLLVVFCAVAVGCGTSEVPTDPSVPNHFTTQTSQDHRMYGVAFYKDAAGWYVGVVLPDSDAAKAGFHQGDRVRELDGQMVDASFDMTTLGKGPFRNSVVTLEHAGALSSPRLVLGGHDSTDCQAGTQKALATGQLAPSCGEGLCPACCSLTVFGPKTCDTNWNGQTDCVETGPGTCSMSGSTCSSF